MARWIRLAAAAALALLAVVSVSPAPASAARFGPIPHVCTSLKEKGHCMVHTGLGEMHLSSHYLHLGDAFTATITKVPQSCFQYNPCVSGVDWRGYGCARTAFTCHLTLTPAVVAAGKTGTTTSGGNPYTSGELGGGWLYFEVTIFSGIGSAVSSDYFGVLAPGEDLSSIGPHDQPGVATTLRSPAQVPLDPVDVGRSALLAAGLVFLVAFPGELFNSTLQAHYDEVVGWFGWLPWRRGRPPAAEVVPPAGEEDGLPHTPPWVIPLVFVFTAGVGSLIDPKFGFDLASLEGFIGALGAAIFTTFVYTGISALLMRATEGRWGGFRLYAGGIVVVLTCAAISRLAHAQPGYLYGVVLAYTLGQHVIPKHREGRLVAAGFVVVLATSLLVWFAWTPVKNAAGSSHAVPLVVLSALMSSIFLGGMTSLVFGMIPLSFLPGQKLVGWRRVAWGLLFAVALFLFVHVVLNAAAGTPHPEYSYVGAVSLFAGFGAFSTAFWAYFRYRPAAAPGIVRA
ncbi:MAG: hypothetical protein NVSMB17_08830 [Candidatus Dormibacteria bacterium]